MAGWQVAGYLVSFLLSVVYGQSTTSFSSSCYRRGEAVRCIPPFINAAFNLPIRASHTCGNVARFPPQKAGDYAKYCEQTGVLDQIQMCESCDDRFPQRSHPPSFAVDTHNSRQRTRWQSITLYEYIDRGFGSMVQDELILSLGKSFDITYVKITFHSPRPESFAISKKTNESAAWQPYQFYSGSCNRTYGRPNSEANDIPTTDTAICVDDFSDISPLTGGKVVFSTMKNRPGAYNFLDSPDLQEFVTATDIKIKLTRLNTFGDEIFGNKIVLQSYYYAISDISIGARCKCNGHASRCVPSTGQDTRERLVCECQHNTMGVDCSECKPMFKDQPWGIATEYQANECKACKCNGMASKCFYDKALWLDTGSGSHCLDCRDNTAGVNCEKCKENYYGTPPVSRCLSCNCDGTGSLHLQCDEIGQCPCKPGVKGLKCNECDANYYDFSAVGCRECNCVVPGSLANSPSCSSETGQCSCKGNVEGQNCDKCKPGYFNQDLGDPLGCMACFCYGHTSECSSAPAQSSGFRSKTIASLFTGGSDGWVVETASGTSVPVQHHALTEFIGAEAPGSEATYFVAPDRFLDAARFSYNQFLRFDLRVGSKIISQAREAVILEGAGLRVSIPIFRQDNPMPTTEFQKYRFRLNERVDYTWSPLLTAFDFQKLLQNLTAIKIRTSYTDNGLGFLDNVQLVSARIGGGGSVDDAAPFVEYCSCPKGYTGQFCESCAPEYRREDPSLGSYSRCIPCDCNGHSKFCDVDSGQCVCQHNTDGDHCERCEEKFFGNALLGTNDSCMACPCPEQGACFQQMDGTVTCLHCPEGTSGNQCDFCADGYYDVYYTNRTEVDFVAPSEGLVCDTCECNENIDSNAVGNCNRTSGLCLKCIYNTTGDHCERCIDGFFGDALSSPKGDCEHCDCYPLGTEDDDTENCEMASGQCVCRPNVEGRRCEVCTSGYWNISSGEGCSMCDCDSTGSLNNTCDISTGQCDCQSGVTGLRCNQCEVDFFGFSASGCTDCECNTFGSDDGQCDEMGQCPCLEGRAFGVKCDMCNENKYNLTAGCLDCPTCYNLVRDDVALVRQLVSNLSVDISFIESNPVDVNDTNFKALLDMVHIDAQALLDEVIAEEGTSGLLKSTLDRFLARLAAVNATLAEKQEVVRRQNDTFSSLDLSGALATIEEVTDRLKFIGSELTGRGFRTLSAIQDAVEKFGKSSENMTMLAQEAQELALDHEQLSSESVSASDQAHNTSMEAAWLARNFTARVTSSLGMAGAYEFYLLELSVELHRAREAGLDALKHAKAVFGEALVAASKVDAARIPEFNGTDFEEDALAVKTLAEEIRANATASLQNLTDTIEAQQLAVNETLAALEEAVEAQRQADILLALVDQAHEKALEARNKANAILEEAVSIRDQLQNFDVQVRASKARAEEDLKKIGQIQASLEEAERKTADAEGGVLDAVSKAETALNVAKNAETTADRASEAASNLKVRANQTMEHALSLENSLEGLVGRVAETEGLLNASVLESEDNRKAATDALDKADVAINEANKATNLLDKALDDLKVLDDLLDKLPDLDLDGLMAIERELNATEDYLDAENLDDDIADLATFSKKQQQTVENYGITLDGLRKQVQDIEQITMYIPERCLTKTKNEQKRKRRRRLRQKKRKRLLKA